MALKILQSGMNPLGQFDGLDTIATTVKGGEVVSFTYINSFGAGGTDKNAFDVNDGYVTSAHPWRPAVTTTLLSGMRPLYLCDEGTVGYGMIFGIVVGGATGQQVNGPTPPFSGAVLGPHSATGSGKLTLWDKPGLYGVTLDAVDTTVSTGLVPTNAALSGSDKLFASPAGLLSPNSGNQFENYVVARFIDFSTNDSKVTTTVDMVSALNSPSGPISSVALKPFTQAIIQFNPGV